MQYIWREELLLEGERFGRFAGERTTMLCGATMVLDQNGNQIQRIDNTKTYAAAFKQAGIAVSKVPKFATFERASFDKPQAPANGS